MRYRQRKWLLAAAGFALVVECVSTLGWSGVEKTRKLLQTDPGAAAAYLDRSFCFHIPAAVLLSRRINLSQFSGLPAETVGDVLKKLSRLQMANMPSASSGWLNRGRLEMIIGHLDEADMDLKQALIRNPTDPFILRLRALLLRHKGHLEESLDLLAQADAYAPDFRQPPIDLVPEDLSRVQLEGIRLRMKAYPRLKTETTLRLVRILSASGKREEAEEILESLAGDPRIDLLRVQWALEENDPVTAMRLGRKIASESRLPSKIRGQALAYLAEARALSGDMDGAVEAAAQARRLAPSIADPYRALARIAEKKGDLQTALLQLRKAWGMAPSNLSVLYELARVAEAVGQDADARLALQRAVELYPDNPDPARRLIDYLFRRGAYMDAAMALSEALDHNPTDAALLQRAEKLHREVTGRK